MSDFVVTKQEYIYLRDSVLLDTNNYSSNKNHVAVLKHKYAGIINSTRRYDSIKTLRELLEVLEKRDVVSENDIRELEEIAKETGNVQFIEEMDTIRSNLNRINNVSFYPTPIITREFSRNIRNYDKYDVKSRVREVIITQLGNKWIDFARELKMVESKIDRLKIRYDNNTEKCIEEVLDFHEQRAHPREWKTLLLDALEKARRNDLKKEVNRIFDTFSD